MTSFCVKLFQELVSCDFSLLIYMIKSSHVSGECCKYSSW